MGAVTGTSKAERDRIRAENRRQRQVQHMVARAKAARTGHDKVKAATLAALATSKRLRDDVSLLMARALAEVVERFDTADNWEAK